MSVLSERRERWLVRLLQLALAAIAAYGLLQGNTGVVVNGALGLAVTFVPTVLRRDVGVSLPTWYVLCITAAIVLHTIGIMGPYKTVPWYDSLTHALSASIVAGVGYATVVAVDENSERTNLGSELRFAFVLVFVLAFGVFWEILEFTVGMFGGKGMLIQYGLDDTVHDLVFDALGGLVIAGWDTAQPDSAADTLSETVEE